jgi:PAS domain S-box-containing protein
LLYSRNAGGKDVDSKNSELENLTKEELLAIVRALKEQRAFTYEDRMKLAILDESPFTIWASDRDCKITLWEGKCEALYGYSREYAVGKDYIDLFVSSEEQAAARRDQISIIDNAAVFHNIANDIAKTGNILQLITNCFRIKDPRSGQYWNAEMGLIIDYLEQERKRLELIVAESKKVKNCITLFIDNTQKKKIQYQERKKGIRAAIAESKRKAASTKQLTSFKERIAPVNSVLEDLQRKLYQLIDDYFQRIQDCVSAASCEALMLEFDEAYEEMVYRIEDIVVGLEEINSDFSWDNTLMQLRDNLLKANFDSSRRLDNVVFELLKRAEEDIAEYKKLGVKSESKRLTEFTKRRDDIQALRENITNVSNEFTGKTQQSTDNMHFNELRSKMIEAYRDIESRLSSFRCDMGVSI